LQAGIELHGMNKKSTKEQRKEKTDPHGSSKASLHAKAFVFDYNGIYRRTFLGRTHKIKWKQNTS
jgi:hypothetical protein